MSSPETDDDRWEELQATRLLFGLSLDEQAEYDRLAKRMPRERSEIFESVVASLDVAWSDSKTMLPEHLRKTIRDQGVRELSAQPVFPNSTRGLPPATPRTSWAPWLVSAACLAIAVLTVVSNRSPNPPQQDIAQLRAELISVDKDIVQVKWADGPTPIAGAAGDVVWSPAKQTGFMRFRGLTVNDPTVNQYQLWIFDKNQSDKTPVDGGVFDISSAGEVIVPIHAKLRVSQAYLFAVTIEKPGGTVVSSREQLPLLATVN